MSEFIQFLLITSGKIYWNRKFNKIRERSEKSRTISKIENIHFKLEHTWKQKTITKNKISTFIKIPGYSLKHTIFTSIVYRYIHLNLEHSWKWRKLWISRHSPKNWVHSLINILRSFYKNSIIDTYVIPWIDFLRHFANVILSF